MTILRKCLLLVAVLYLAPAAIALEAAAGHAAMPAMGDTCTPGSSAGGHGGEETCADSGCCSVCSAGLVVVRVHAAAPPVLRDVLAVREHGPLARAEFPPPFRPPIG